MEFKASSDLICTLTLTQTASKCDTSFILEKFKCKKVENVDVKDTILLISLDYKTKQASILTFMCLTLQSQK